jgi:hypothetical protein
MAALPWKRRTCILGASNEETGWPSEVDSTLVDIFIGFRNEIDRNVTCINRFEWDQRAKDVLVWALHDPGRSLALVFTGLRLVGRKKKRKLPVHSGWPDVGSDVWVTIYEGSAVAADLLIITFPLLSF